MIPGADKQFIDALRALVDSAPTERERQAREQAMLELLFEGTDAAEATRIRALLAAGAAPRVRVEDDAPEPDESPESATTPVASEPDSEEPRRRTWSTVKLYDPSREALSRSTREEGLGDETSELRDEARGTPFFGRPSPRRASPRTMQDRERLLRLMRGLPPPHKGSH